MRSHVVVLLTAIALAVPIHSAWAESVVTGLSEQETWVRSTRDGCAASLSANTRWNTLDYRNACNMAVTQKSKYWPSFSRRSPTMRCCPVRWQASPSAGSAISPNTPALPPASPISPTFWDGREGRPSSQGKTVCDHENECIAGFIEQTGLMELLAGPLQLHGLVPQHIEVEKVFVGHPADTPFKSWLLDQGIAAESHLPYDAVTWITLTRPSNAHLTMCSAYNEISQEAACLLTEGSKAKDHDVDLAIILLRLGIDRLGYSYQDENGADDTSLSLILAKVEFDKGNFAASANLYEDVLDTRLTIFSVRSSSVQ